MSATIRIVSDGTAKGTRVYTADGYEIKGIRAITFSKIEPGGMVEAQLDFGLVRLDVTALSDDIAKAAKVE